MIKIDPDGYKIAGIFLVLAVLNYICYYSTGLSVVSWIFWLLLVFFGFTLWFFRDPERKEPDDNLAVVSSADGVVVDVSQIKNGGTKELTALRIAVFMNVFNVHVNRSPISGRVVRTEHRPGKKLSAFNKRAEYENEYGDTDIETSSGLFRIRQIAGLIARRVVTRVKAGDVLGRGDRIGLIRFGSRVDVFLPLVYDAVVSKGDRVRAGETVIARKSASVE